MLLNPVNFIVKLCYVDLKVKVCYLDLLVKSFYIDLLVISFNFDLLVKSCHLDLLAKSCYIDQVVKFCYLKLLVKFCLCRPVNLLVKLCYLTYYLNAANPTYWLNRVYWTRVVKLSYIDLLTISCYINPNLIYFFFSSSIFSRFLIYTLSSQAILNEFRSRVLVTLCPGSELAILD